MLKIKDLFMSIILYRFNKLLRYKYEIMYLDTSPKVQYIIAAALLLMIL
jgi:hypothetical protein